MLMKSYLIKKNVIFMTSMGRRDSKMVEHTLDMVWTTFWEVSLAWVAAEDNRVAPKR